MTIRCSWPIMRLVLAFSVLLASVWPASSAAVIWLQSSPDRSSQTVSEHVGKGYEFVKDERYQEAAAEFQAALALDPKQVRARYQLAVCWFALFRLAEARAEFNRVRQEIGDDPMTVYHLGRIDLTEGKADSAIRNFRSVVSNPPFPDTAYYLGSTYLLKSDFPAAEHWLRTAAEATPRDYRVHDHLARVYQKERRTAEAESEYALSSRLRASVNEASRVAVACSHELEASGMAKGQATCSELFDARDPDKLTTLGMLYGRHGFFAEAVAPLEQAARLDPDSSEIQHDLGLTYFRLRRYKEARVALEKAVAWRGDFFGSCALLGATLYALGDQASSYPVLRHAHQLNPEDQDTAHLLFNVAMVLAQGEFQERRYEKCLSYLEAAAEANPSDPGVHRRLAAVFGLLGRPADQDREQSEADRLENSRQQ